jgi:hypothetical protein
MELSLCGEFIDFRANTLVPITIPYLITLRVGHRIGSRGYVTNVFRLLATPALRSLVVLEMEQYDLACLGEFLRSASWHSHPYPALESLKLLDFSQSIPFEDSQEIMISLCTGHHLIM